jgi:hypothetical protein
MEAEITHDKDRRDANLRQSIALLEEAIDRFSKIEKFGPMDAEVGDCYSLLGRTYLTSKNFTKKVHNAPLLAAGMDEPS